MATLKRDNGIMSFYYDMFQLAKSNLEYAREQPAERSLGALLLRQGDEAGRPHREDRKKRADEAFQRAIQFDLRERNYGAHFYRALALIDQKNPALNPEIAKALQDYLMASMRFASEEAASRTRCRRISTTVRLHGRSRRREVAADRARRSEGHADEGGRGHARRSRRCRRPHRRRNRTAECRGGRRDNL